MSNTCNTFWPNKLCSHKPRIATLCLHAQKNCDMHDIVLTCDKMPSGSDRKSIASGSELPLYFSRAASRQPPASFDHGVHSTALCDTFFEFRRATLVTRRCVTLLNKYPASHTCMMFGCNRLPMSQRGQGTEVAVVVLTCAEKMLSADHD